MRIRARAVFDPENFKALGIPSGRGFLLLEIEGDYRAKVGEEVKKIVKRQADKYADALAKWNAVPPEQRGPEPVYRDTLLDLELDLTIHYALRSVKQNGLMWSLYEIEANYLNGTPTYSNGYWTNRLPAHIITPMQIHDDDVEVYAKKENYRIPKEKVKKFARGVEYAEMGRVTSVVDSVVRPDCCEVVVTQTTSFLSTVEMSEWTKRILDRIVENGLLRSDESRFIGLKKDLDDIIKGKKKGVTK